MIQNKWQWTVQQADTLMLLPEGVIVIVAFPMGMILDRYKVCLHTRLVLISVSMIITALVYCTLAMTNVNPLCSMLALGFAYGVANVGYWASIPMVCEGHLMSMAAGIVGAMLSFLPAIVPVVSEHIAQAFGRQTIHDQDAFKVSACLILV